MNNTVTLKSFLSELPKKWIYRSTIPLEYAMGFPVVQIVNKQVVLKIPFYKFSRKPLPNKSYVFPIRFVISVLWPGGKVISFEDLAFVPTFSQLPFDQPVGRFPHETVENYPKGQYDAQKDELFALYDKFLAFLSDGSDFTDADEAQFKKLLNALIETSLLPIYKALDKKFADKFLNSEDYKNE